MVSLPKARSAGSANEDNKNNNNDMAALGGGQPGLVTTAVDSCLISPKPILDMTTHLVAY